MPRVGLFLLIILVVTFKETEAIEPIVRLRHGDLQGTIVSGSGGRVTEFLGVPYALPPTGARRFRPPIAHPGWNGTFQASSFGPACPQPIIYSTSEDCLTLNLWAPSVIPDSNQFGVLVVLQGEMFLTSEPKRFSGSDLASRGLIVVTVNYRTNAFGFLHFPENGIQGNLGLKDQSLALRWIHENIGRFGGDTRRIALLGHSAGAASAGFHLTATPSQGLFTRVILLSGAPTSGWALKSSPDVAARYLLQSVGCEEKDSEFRNTQSQFLNTMGTMKRSVIHCLQRVQTQQIMRAVVGMMETNNPDLMFGPVVEYSGPERLRMVSSPPMQALLKKRAQSLPILASFTELDGSVMLYLKQELSFLKLQDLSNFTQNFLVPMAISLGSSSLPAYSSDDPIALYTSRKIIQSVVEFAYELNEVSESNNTGTLRLNIIKMFSDALFKAPIMQFVKGSSAAAYPTYLMMNDGAVPGVYGAGLQIPDGGSSHGGDLLLLSGISAVERLTRSRLTPEQIRHSEILQRLIINFVERGRPTMNDDKRNTWLPFTAENEFGVRLKTGRKMKPGEEGQTDLWSNLFAKINHVVAKGFETYESSPPVERKKEPKFVLNSSSTTTTTSSTTTTITNKSPKVLPIKTTERYELTTSVPWRLITQNETSAQSMMINRGYQFAVWGLLCFIALMMLTLAGFALWNRRKDSLKYKRRERDVPGPPWRTTDWSTTPFTTERIGGKGISRYHLTGCNSPKIERVAPVSQGNKKSKHFLDFFSRYKGSWDNNITSPGVDSDSPAIFRSLTPSDRASPDGYDSSKSRNNKPLRNENPISNSYVDAESKPIRIISGCSFFDDPVTRIDYGGTTISRLNPLVHCKDLQKEEVTEVNPAAPYISSKRNRVKVAEEVTEFGTIQIYSDSMQLPVPSQNYSRLDNDCCTTMGKQPHTFRLLSESVKDPDTSSS